MLQTAGAQSTCAHGQMGDLLPSSTDLGAGQCTQDPPSWRGYGSPRGGWLRIYYQFFFSFFLGTSARDLTFYLDFRHRRSFLWQTSTPMRTATFCFASTLVKSCLSPALNLAILHRLMSLHCSQNRCYAVICDTQTPLHRCKWRHVQQPKTHCVEKVLYEVIKNHNSI